MSVSQSRTTENPDQVSHGYRRAAALDMRRSVDRHFEAIARRYDRANTILSFGLHHLWKRCAMRQLELKRGDRVLDLCGGTADLAIIAARRVAPEGIVAVYDMNMAMMRAGRPKANHSGYRDSIVWVQGDAEAICFPDNTFDAVTVGFGIRNLVRLEDGLGEIHRVLKRGAPFMILEFSMPKTGWIRNLYGLYSSRIMPFVGRTVAGTTEPFNYLAESIRTFPAPEAVATALEACGFTRVSFRRLSNGIVVVYTGERSHLASRAKKG